MSAASTISAVMTLEREEASNAAVEVCGAGSRLSVVLCLLGIHAVWLLWVVLCFVVGWARVRRRSSSGVRASSSSSSAPSSSGAAAFWPNHAERGAGFGGGGGDSVGHSRILPFVTVVGDAVAGGLARDLVGRRPVGSEAEGLGVNVAGGDDLAREEAPLVLGDGFRGDLRGQEAPWPRAWSARRWSHTRQRPPRR